MGWEMCIRDSGAAGRIVAWSLAAAASLAAIVWYGVPLIADQLTPLVPRALERRTGEVADGQARSMFSGGVCTTTEGQAALDKLVAGLKKAPAAPAEAQVAVLSSDTVNAFALPGGRVYVLSGLIDLAQSPDEVAGVLAHEFGHVAHRDSMKVMIEQGSAAFVIGLFFGDVFGAGAIAAAAREAGFNRVSIGVQSFDGGQRASLGRVHTREQAVAAFSAARRAGFQNISLDLMFGLPGQTLSDLHGTLASAIDLGPEHLSAYSLTIEEGTPLFERVRAGEVTPPDDDLAADMYQAVRQTLTRAGYEHYEISNYALPSMRCRHNEAYWRNGPYLGFGAGAAQYVAGERLTWEGDPVAFTGQIESDGRASTTRRPVGVSSSISAKNVPCFRRVTATCTTEPSSASRSRTIRS